MFADGRDMVEQFDWEFLGELLSDSRQTIGSVDQVIQSPLLARLISQATGKIKTALRFGYRYSDKEMMAMQGDDLEYLKLITCIWTMSLAIGRRPGVHMEYRAEIKAEAEGELEALRNGQTVFSLEPSAGHIEAGTIKDGGPGKGATELQMRNIRSLSVDRLSGRLFGYREGDGRHQHDSRRQ